MTALPPPCCSSATAFRAEVLLFLSPPALWLLNEGCYAWSDTWLSHVIFSLVVAAFTIALLGFSIYYWFFASDNFSFWEQLATLTNWSLFITLIHHAFFLLRAWLGPIRPTLFWSAKIGTAVLHLWPVSAPLPATLCPPSPPSPPPPLSTFSLQPGRRRYRAPFASPP